MDALFSKCLLLKCTNSTPHFVLSVICFKYLQLIIAELWQVFVDQAIGNYVKIGLQQDDSSV